jgi:outer membrane receptor protein involved in Fe transport
VNGGFDFVTNGNTARSRGVETELTLPLSDSTKMQLGYSYTDAILTSGFTAGVVPDLVGVSGNRLPGVSRQQATVAVDYGVPFGADREFHAHADAAYRSDFWTSLPSSPTAAELPGFLLLNARAGMGFDRAWRVDAFINNITNREAATSVSTEPGLAHNRADFVGRPRTIGLELSYSFKDH